MSNKIIEVAYYYMIISFKILGVVDWIGKLKSPLPVPKLGN